MGTPKQNAQQMTGGPHVRPLVAWRAFSVDDLAVGPSIPGRSLGHEDRLLPGTTPRTAERSSATLLAIGMGQVSSWMKNCHVLCKN
jgi:hypothetical protein